MLKHVLDWHTLYELGLFVSFYLERRLYFWLKTEKSKRNKFIIFILTLVFLRDMKSVIHMVNACVMIISWSATKVWVWGGAGVNSEVHSAIVVIMNVVLQWGCSVDSRKSGQIHLSHAVLLYQHAIFAVGLFSADLISPTAIEMNERNCLGK